MSLVDVIIQLVDHPLAKQLTPIALDVWDDQTDKRRLQLRRAALDAEVATLSASWSAVSRTPSDPPQSPIAGGKTDDLYSAENKYDTGCAVCGKAHLAATAGMLDRAAKIAQTAGSCDDDCTYYVAAAQREIVNLTGYDWTERQIQATSPSEQAVLRQWTPAVETMQSTLFVGTESVARENLAKASGALEEAGRFARASGVQHPEAQLRIADAEALLAETERAEWSPERRQTMDSATRAVVDANLPKFRKQRQFLLNGIATPDDLDRVAAEVGGLNAQLQALAVKQLTPSQVQAMADHARHVRMGFREDLAQAHAPIRQVTQQAIQQGGG